MKSSHLTAGCLFVAIALVVAYPSHGAESRSLNMDVRIQHVSPGQLEMEVSLTNIGKSPIRFYRVFLPWEHRYSLQVIIARGYLGRGGVLEGELPIRDPQDSDKVELKAGQTIRGTISLNERFRTLSEEIRARGLHVFWTYAVEPIDGSSVERLGGWTFVEKEGASPPPVR
jgi:hypothetical protein